MSQTQYNSLMSSMLNRKHTLAKLRAELKGKKEKIYFSCKRFRYLAQNCRNKAKGEKGKTVSQNKFEMLSSQMMQCVREEQHMWQYHKKRSRRGDQHTHYGERHRNIAAYRACL